MGVVLASLPVLAELAILLGASIAAIMAALISVSPKPRPRTENERYYIDPVSGDRCPFPSLFDDLDQDASHTSNTDGLNKRKSGTSSESNPRVTLSIIIPAFDESRRLPVMLEETYAYLEQRCARDPRFSYEIIVVDDASRDNTANIARGFAKEKRMVGGLMRVMQLEKNRGKGGAVTQGMLVARGDYLLFADADGATKFSDLDNLETKLKEVAVNGMGVGIGSRAHMVKSAAVVKRSFIRNFLMHSFHTILYVLGIKKIKDTQCGFKLLTRPAARTIFPNMHVEGWIFDIELLLITDYLKIPMVEVGVNWHEVDGSKVSLLRDSVRMLKDLLVIRMNYWTGLWRVRRVAVGNSDKGKGNKQQTTLASFFGKGAPSKGSKSQPSKKAVEKSDDAGASQDSGKKKRLVKAKNSKKRVASDSDEDFEQPTKSSYFESKPEPTNKKKKIAEDSDDAVEEIDPDSFFKTKPSGSKTQKGTRSQATPAKKSPAAATTKKKNEPEEKPKTQKAEPMVIDSEPEEIEEVLPANKAPTPPKKEASTAEKKSSAPRTLPWKKSGTSSVNKKDEAEKVEIKDSGSSSRKPAASPAAPKPKVNDSSAKTTPEKPATSPAAPEPKEKDSSAKTSPEKDAETDKKRKGGSGASQWFAKKARMDAGPKAPGSKEIPEGEENCLAGLTFVFTGELSSISREQAADLAKKYGGRVTSAPSSKTSYLVVGEDAGQSKLDKAKKLNLKTIDEDAFLDLIRTSKGKSEEDAQKGASKGKGKTPAKASTAKKTASASASPAAQPATKASTKATTTNTASAKSTASAAPTEQNLWTVKYAPKSYAEVIGNKAIVDKMAKWLQQWDKNLASGFKKGGKDDPSGWRCLLLSGPPGIGKTTAAHLVARLEGWEPVEFNASDTRSKNALDRLVRELTGSHTMTEYFTVDADDGKKGKNAKAPPKKRQVIIMDEVDGMSAGDRGGMAQLILLIKKTKVPIICICNDRQSTKVRSLANHCMDLRFRRPTEQQVENRIRAICQIEGLSLKPNVVGQLVQSTQADVRQILNMLSTYRLSQDSLSYDQSKQLAKASEKNVTLGPWDITGKLLGGSSFRNASTAEKIEYYFQDYQLIPLMIQENYAKMNPILAQELTKDQRSCALETLNLVSQAAESLSDSDLIEKALRGGNEWGLMPAHAVMSTVRPAFFMHGSGGGYGGPGGGGYAFPSWLGQNSKQNKSYRQLREVQIRMRLRISGDKGEVRQSYIPALAPILTEPLVKDGKDGVPDVIARMDDYYLGRDDWESVLDLSVGSYEKDKIMSKIPSAVKSNFTSSYNKRTHPTPFMSAQAASSKPVKLSAEAAPDLEDVVEADDMGDVDADEEHKSDEEDVATDRLIKQKKTASSGSGGAKASGSRKASSSSSKGRRK